jgi:hypothetical protein
MLDPIDVDAIDLLKSSLTGYESSLLLSGTCSLLLILPI